MDSNELMKELYFVMKTSGLLDKVTEHFKEHPELFCDGVYGDSKITSMNMSVLYQSESLSTITDIKPCIFISMGSVAATEHDFNVYDTGTIESRTWIDGEIIKEEKSNV